MVFTILMPAQSNTLSTQPVMLPRGIGLLRFKVELQENREPCVYMNLCRLESDTVLDGIGNFPKDDQELWRFIAILTTYSGTALPYMFACAALAGIPVIELPLFIVSWIGGGPYIVSSAVESVDEAEYWKIEVRVLGSKETHSYESMGL